MLGHHVSDRIVYLGWTNEPAVWTSKVDGDEIHHSGALGDRTSRDLNYQDWDSKNCTVRLRSGRLVNFAGNQELSQECGVLRYKTADGSLWSSTWDGEYFHHSPKPANTGIAQVPLVLGGRIRLSVDWVESVETTEECDETVIHLFRFGAFVPHGVRIPPDGNYYAFYRGHRRGDRAGFRLWDRDNNYRGRPVGDWRAGVSDPVLFDGPISGPSAFVGFVMEQQPSNWFKALVLSTQDLDGMVATAALDALFPDLYLSKLGLAVGFLGGRFRELREQAGMSWNNELIGVFGATFSVDGDRVVPKYQAWYGSRVVDTRQDNPQLVNGGVAELNAVGRYRFGFSARRV